MVVCLVSGRTELRLVQLFTGKGGSRTSHYSGPSRPRPGSLLGQSEVQAEERSEINEFSAFVGAHMTAREIGDLTRALADSRGVLLDPGSSVSARVVLRRLLESHFTTPEIEAYKSELERRRASGLPLLRRAVRTNH